MATCRHPGSLGGWLDHIKIAAQSKINRAGGLAGKVGGLSGTISLWGKIGGSMAGIRRQVESAGGIQGNGREQLRSTGESWGRWGLSPPPPGTRD